MLRVARLPDQDVCNASAKPTIAAPCGVAAVIAITLHKAMELQTRLCNGQLELCDVAPQSAWCSGTGCTDITTTAATVPASRCADSRQPKPLPTMMYWTMVNMTATATARAKNIRRLFG